MVDEGGKPGSEMKELRWDPRTAVPALGGLGNVNPMLQTKKMNLLLQIYR
jgi:hypothetical protein